MNKLSPITDRQIKQVCDFLAEQRKRFTREQWQASYQSWWRGGFAWDKLRSGGTDQQSALTWYQQFHKPGSKEWRPSIIIDAVCRAAGMDGAQDKAGVFLLCCGNCGIDLGRIEGDEGEQDKTECPRCGWWITYQWVKEDGIVLVDFLAHRGQGEKP